MVFNCAALLIFALILCSAFFKALKKCVYCMLLTIKPMLNNGLSFGALIALIKRKNIGAISK